MIATPIEDMPIVAADDTPLFDKTVNKLDDPRGSE